MPINIRRQVGRASVVLVMAAIALGMAAIVSASVTAPVKAPQLSSTQTKLLFRGETDLWLRDHQQLRRSFFEQPRDRLK
jgi:4-hydroxy-L-threonine phosphate dehydrogenase PdxA